MIIEVLAFVFGLLALVKGADLLVDSAARIAKQFGVSDFLIGLTIVAVGTSLPELAASVTAAYYGDTALAVGNIIGSNIANLGLILGLSGLFMVIRIDKEMYSRDGFLMLLATLLFYGFALNGVISRIEGGFFLWLFTAYTLFFITMKRKFKQEFHFKQYFSEFIGLKKRSFIEELNGSLYAGLDYYAYKEILKGIFYELRKILTMASEAITEQALVIKYFLKQLAFFSLGLVGVLFGANLVVLSSTAFPIPPTVIGLLLVSVGTSLPELAVAVSAVKKSYQNIMVGNVIGSNIANILLVAGLSAATRELTVSTETVTIYLPFLLAMTWLFLVFSRNDYRISRIEALTLLLMYLGFIAFIALQL